MKKTAPEEELIEVTQIAFGVSRTLALWGPRAQKVFPRNKLYRTGRKKRKLSSFPFVRLRGNEHQKAFLKFLLEKGISVYDCILFGRILPSEVFLVLKELE